MARRLKKAPRPRRPRHKRIDVTRGEFDALLALLNERATFMDDLRRDLDIQFKRIAHIQAELDRLTALVTKLSTMM